ncbi:MAG: hypothetical protein ACYTEQ_12395 [Planctomycetota bacterium]|jgi:hypothetical protein
MKWLHGGLKDHPRECSLCEGTGADGDEECGACEGEGNVGWGSFYSEGNGACDECQKECSHVAEMFEGGDSDWVCLPCYLRIHSALCGCELWKQAEDDVLKEQS